MEPKQSYDNFDQEVIHTIEREMLACWERYGVERLAVTANTLQEFEAQSLPEQIKAWEKLRTGKRVLVRREVHGTDHVVEEWPEDDQQTTRYPSLVYVREGEAEIQIGDYVVACPKGHFILMAPRVPKPIGQKSHVEEPHHNKSCEVWWFHSTGNTGYIALSVCYSVEKQHINSGHYYIVGDMLVCQLFDILIHEAQDRPSYSNKTIGAILQTFLLTFLREIEHGRFYNRGTTNLPHAMPGSTSPIVAAQRYIDKNLNHPLTIESVAQVVYMSRTNFTRKFLEETGQTFTQYLTERRLDESKHWLLQENCSIEVVCQFVGLKHTQFHKIFRRHFGMTPAEFRKTYKKTQ